jgi:ADP-L-glycero-D-manno-heptose 6-epimerase
MFIVTGAAGFIGSAFVWELNQRGITNIICVDNFGSSEKWKNLNKLQFSDFVTVDDLFGFLDKPDTIQEVKGIFHMGACSSTSEMNMDYLLKNNYYYSQHLFRWSAKHQKKFIYASSAATYGDGSNGYDDATDSNKLSPLNPYGYSKVLFDRWVLKQTNIPPQWIGLKFFNVYGPQEYHKEEMSSVVFKAFHQISESKTLKLFKSHNPQYKDGHQMRDFIYIKDVTRWMWELHHYTKASGIYNIGTGNARTWIDLGESVFKALEMPVKIDWIDTPEHLRKHYQYFTEAKMDKLFKAGLSSPEWPLEKGIYDYVRNYLMKRQDPYL